MYKRKSLYIGLLALFTSLLIGGVGIWSVAAQESPLELNDPVSGTLSNSEAVNRWTFEGNREDVLEFTIDIGQGDLTPRLRLYNSRQELLTQLTAAPVNGESSLVFRLPSFDRYTLEIQSPQRGSEGEYQLTMQLLEAGLHQFEQGELFFGQTVSQRLNDQVPYHIWSFSGQTGQVVDIRMAAIEGDLQPVLSLTSPGGDVIATSTRSDPQSAHLLAFRLPGTGVYRISARRAGESLGFGGDTSGRYELNLTLRNGTEVSRLPLRTGNQITGRLTLDSPMALYEVVDRGNYAIRVELSNPDCLVAIGLSSLGLQLNPEQVGRSPFTIITTIPNAQEPTLEVSSRNCPTPERIDFQLSFLPLNSDLPITSLPYDQTVYSDGVANLERWAITGRVGDIIELEVEKAALTSDSFIRLVSPQLVTLYRQTFLHQIRQTIELTENGIYFLQIASNKTPYTVRYRLVGQESQRFAFTTPISEETFDITAPQSRSIALQGGFETNTVLVVEGPDGQSLASTRANVLTNARLENVYLPSAGRYRIKVYGDSRPRNIVQTITPGFALSVGQPAKGTLSAEQPFNIWTVDLHQDDEVAIRLDGLNLGGASNLYFSLLSTTGQMLLPQFSDSSNATQQFGTFIIPQDGLYQVLITSNGQQTYLDYRLTITQPTIPNTQQTALLAPVGSGFTPTPTLTDPDPFIVGSLAQSVSPVLATANPIALPNNLRADVLPQQRYQVWRFNSLRNQLLDIQANGLNPNQAPPGLALLDENGQVIAEVWGQATKVTQLHYRTPASGRYYLVLMTDLVGGRYWITAKNDPRLDEQVPSVIQVVPIGIGQTYTADFQRPNEIDTYGFWGERGNTITFVAQLTIGNIQPRLELIAPANYTVKEAEFDPDTSASTLEAVRLPETGLYQLKVHATRNNDEGFSRYSLYNTVIGGQNVRTGLLDGTVVDSLGINGNENHWLFSAQAGEEISLSLVPLSNSGPVPLALTITDSEGNPFIRQSADLTLNEVSIDRLMLPRDGVYQAVVTGGSNAVGAYQLAIERHPLATQLGTTDTALSYNNTRSGLLNPANRYDRWVIAANQGDVLQLSAHIAYGDVTPIGFQLQTADGELLVAGADRGNNYGAREEGILIPQTGVYALTVGSTDPAFQGSTVYQISLALQNQTQQSAAGRLAYPEVTYYSTLYADDPNDMWLLEGRAGDTVTITIQGDGILIPVLIFSPSGTTSPDASISRSGTQTVNAELQGYVLPADGVYVLHVFGAETSVGRYSLRWRRTGNTLDVPQLIEPGILYQGEIENPAQSQRWIFNGLAGDQIRLELEVPRRSALVPSMKVISPAGHILVEQSRFDGKILSLESYLLPQAGAYILQIDSPQKGEYSLNFRQVKGTPPPDPRLLTYNNAGLSALSADNTEDEWAFDGATGDIIRLSAVHTNGDVDLILELYDPVGNLIAQDDDSLGNLDAQLQVALPTMGRYRIRIASLRPYLPEGENNYRIELLRVYQPVITHLGKGELMNYGQRYVGSFNPITPDSSEFQSLHFKGQAGDTIQAILQFPSDDSPLRLFLADGFGNRYAQGERVGDRAVINNFTLPSDGTYLFIIQRSLDSLITQYYPFSLSLSLLDGSLAPQNDSPFIGRGETVSGQLSLQTPSNIWLFQGEANERVHVSLVGLDSTHHPALILLDNSGQVVMALPASDQQNQISQQVTLPSDGVYQWVVSGDSRLDSQPYRFAVDSESESLLVGQLTQQTTEYGYFSPSIAQQRWLIAGYDGQLNVRLETDNPTFPLTMLLQDQQGQVITQADTSNPDGSLLLSALLRADQAYNLIISKAGHAINSSAGGYQLRISQEAITTEMMDAAMLTPNLILQSGSQDSLPMLYGFYGQKNVPTTIYVSGDSEELDILLRTEQGEVLLTATETVPAVYLPKDGFYFLEVSSRSASNFQIGIFPRPNTTAEPLLESRRQTNIASTLSPNRTAQRWAIEARPGESLIITVNDFSNLTRHELVLYDPNGIPIASAIEPELENEVVIGPVFIGLGGTYTLRIGAWLNTINSETQHILRIDPTPADVPFGSDGGLIPVLGQAVRGGLVATDPADEWHFRGQAGSFMTLALLPTIGESPLQATLTTPSGEMQTLTLQAKDADELLMASGIVLLETGDYRLVISLTDAAIEALTAYELTVELESIPFEDILKAAQILTLDQPQTGELAGQGQAAWVFYSQAGQTVSLGLQSDFPILMTLLDPTGQVLDASQAGAASVIVPALDGFYSVVLRNVSADTIPYGLALTSGGIESTWESPLRLGENKEATFSASATQHVWELSGYSTGDYRVILRSGNPSLTLVPYIADQHQNIISTTQTEASGGVYVNAYLVADESYYLVVTSQLPLINGNYSVIFDVGLNQLSPAPIEVGRITVGRLTPLNHRDEWLLTGTAQQQIMVQIKRLVGAAGIRLRVYAPGYLLLSEFALDNTGNLQTEPIQLPINGTYILQVSRTNDPLSNQEGLYEIQVSSPAP